MRRYYITSRRQLGGVEPLLASIARNAALGVEMIQIRENDLPARELLRLVSAAVAVRRGSVVLVNDRADVALAAGAQGVHLPSNSLAPAELRRITPRGFRIGVSCHTIADLRRAEAESADFTVYGPVFDPLSKPPDRPAIGLDGLRAACAAVAIPIYALGGITAESASQCLDAGAAGIAAITLFQR